jgi:DNA-binding NarL/FixJ family response regulator
METFRRPCRAKHPCRLRSRAGASSTSESLRLPPASPAHDLTPHEIRILRLLVEGRYYQTAADELGVTVNTIRFHLSRIYEKLQVYLKAEAVSKALRERLIR